MNFQKYRLVCPGVILLHPECEEEEEEEGTRSVESIGQRVASEKPTRQKRKNLQVGANSRLMGGVLGPSFWREDGQEDGRADGRGDGQLSHPPDPPDR